MTHKQNTAPNKIVQLTLLLIELAGRTDYKSARADNHGHQANQVNHGSDKRRQM